MKLFAGLRANEAPLVLTLVAVPLVAMAAPLALVSLMIVCVLGQLSLDIARRDIGPRPHPGLALACFCLPALGLVSTLWSIAPEASLERAGKLALVSACALYLFTRAARLSTQSQTDLARWLGVTTTGALAILLFEGLSAGALWRAVDGLIGLPGYDGNRYNRSISVLVLVGPIAAGANWLAGRRRLAGLCLALSLGTPHVLDSGAAQVATVIAVLASLAVLWVGPWRGTVVLVAALAFLAFLMPFWVPPTLAWASMVFGDAIHASLMHRFAIWDFALARVVERPWLGWGLDASPSLPGGDDTAWPRAELMPLHPHNFILQIWLELGIAGLAAALGIVLWLAVGIAAPRQRILVFAGLLSLIGALGIAGASFGIWQSWWLTSLLIAALTWHALVGPAKQRINQ